jgi:hypothetical protein
MKGKYCNGKKSYATGPLKGYFKYGNKPSCSIKAGNPFTSWATISFSRNILLLGDKNKGRKIYDVGADVFECSLGFSFLRNIKRHNVPQSLNRQCVILAQPLAPVRRIREISSPCQAVKAQWCGWGHWRRRMKRTWEGRRRRIERKYKVEEKKMKGDENKVVPMLPYT